MSHTKNKGYLELNESEQKIGFSKGNYVKKHQNCIHLHEFTVCQLTILSPKSHEKFATIQLIIILDYISGRGSRLLLNIEMMMMIMMMLIMMMLLLLMMMIIMMMIMMIITIIIMKMSTKIKDHLNALHEVKNHKTKMAVIFLYFSVMVEPN